jgi:hypothetical protein
MTDQEIWRNALAAVAMHGLLVSTKVVGPVGAEALANASVVLADTLLRLLDETKPK